ncbi:MAG: citramalate synthase [Chlamydiota bacterium]|nr:citramalate synthase [Chlamydiota bacterium]
MGKTIKIYDTTLRDGTQAAGISFSSTDKILIVEHLDRIGLHYIEGGWPGSNPKDVQFFKEIQRLGLKNAKITAFGSTRKKSTTPDKDANLKALLEAQTPVVTIFGKSWILHVKHVLNVSPDENLAMISDSLSFLKAEGREVIYDAEHFFDGFKDDPQYALRTLKAAQDSGADWIVLCDTNGGTLPWDIEIALKQVTKEISVPIGIHTHNDAGFAVANALTAVKCGAVQVQGTINGYGERCGNANLCTIIPNLQLKMGYEVLEAEKLSELTPLSHTIDELANVRHDDRAPYVGLHAFAHKGGTHVNAVKKISKSFEHIEPELVGNRRHILVSELAGKSNVLMKAIELGVNLDKDDPYAQKVVQELKTLENLGYEFEGAEGSFKLLMDKIMQKHKPFFDLEGFRIIVEKHGSKKCYSEATIKLKVNGVMEHTAAEGEGPVNALDNALRKALTEFYPSISKVHLEDYKVRVLDAKAGTEAKVRVLIESTDGVDIWGTVGVSENIIEASWEALVDSVEYKLLKENEKTAS